LEAKQDLVTWIGDWKRERNVSHHSGYYIVNFTVALLKSWNIDQPEGKTGLSLL